MVAAVEQAVSLGIRQLSSMSVQTNAHPLQGNYAFQARTREELLASEALAANHRVVFRDEKPETLQDPAAGLDPESAQPGRAKTVQPQAPQEWLL